MYNVQDRCEQDDEGHSTSLNVDVIGPNYIGDGPHSIAIGTSGGVADVEASSRVGPVRCSQRSARHGAVCSTTAVGDAGSGGVVLFRGGIPIA